MSNTKPRLVAAKLMKRDIVTVSPNDSLKDALALMVENHLTGLPVMDDQCRCVSLITASDILNFAEERSDGVESRKRTCPAFFHRGRAGKRIQCCARVCKVRG